MHRSSLSLPAALVAVILLAAPALSGQVPAADNDYSGFAVTPAFVQQVEQQRLARSLEAPTEFQKSRRRWKKAWIASWIAFAAVNALDTHSSLGRRELNPLFRDSNGRFAAGRATAVKGGVGAALFLWQLHQIRKNPEKNYYKPFTVVTGAAAGALGGIAAHNYAGK